MARMIDGPAEVEAVGSPPKKIAEFIGRVNTGTGEVSIALMISPAGWSEPGQTPEFVEYSVVLEGTLTVETAHATYDVCAGQAVVVESGEWVRYSTPHPGGAEYVSVCLPAFTPDIAHRDG